MFKGKGLLLVGVLLVLGLVLAGWSGPAAAQTSSGALQVVATGLNNPRGLAFDSSETNLLVAEAGGVNTGACFAGPEGETCLGNTGAIARVNVRSGQVARPVTGLPSLSLANPPGFNATGPHAVHRIGSNEFYVLIGLGGNAGTRAGLGAAATPLGHLVRVRSGEAVQPVADFVAFEQSNDPDGEGPDSNPYAMAVRDDRLFVVDAGGNDLLAVERSGKIQTATVFPSRLVPAPPFIQPQPPGGQIPMQAVPNAATVGPEGAIFVGELTGFPFPPGGASVFRVGADGRAERYAGGFTNIIAIDFDVNGNLYVLEIAKDSLLAAQDGPPQGRLVRVDKNTKAQSVVASEGLVAPGGLLVGKDAIFISNFSVFPGQGQIVRISLK